MTVKVKKRYYHVPYDFNQYDLYDRLSGSLFQGFEDGIQLQAISQDKNKVSVLSRYRARSPLGFRVDVHTPPTLNLDPSEVIWLQGSFIFLFIPNQPQTYLCIGRMGSYPVMPDTMHLYSQIFNYGIGSFSWSLGFARRYPNIGNQWIVDCQTDVRAQNGEGNDLPVSSDKEPDWILVLRAIANQHEPTSQALQAQLASKKDIARFYEKNIRSIWADYIAAMLEEDPEWEVNPTLVTQYRDSIWPIPASSLPLPLYYRLNSLYLHSDMGTQTVTHNPYLPEKQRKVIDRTPANVRFHGTPFDLHTPLSMTQTILAEREVELGGTGGVPPFQTFPGSDESILSYGCPLYRKDVDRDTWYEAGMLSPILR